MTKRQHILSRLVLENELENGVEIGVGTGRTSRYMMENHLWLHWIGVDHFPEGYPLWPEERGGTTAERAQQVRNKYAVLVDRFAPRLSWIDRPSIEAAEQFANGTLDLVFIDADHSYEGCKADIEAWRPKLRPGGWLTGHDYDADRYPGVIQAVKELVPGYQLADDFVWLVQVA
jgi:hypothetical protein